jgi:hypothetical protein
MHIFQRNLDNFRFKNIKLTSCIYGGAINLVNVPEVYFAKIHQGFRVDSYCCCRASARQHTILEGTSLRAPSLVDQLESRFFVFACQQFGGGLRKLITLAGRTGSSDRKMHMCFFHILQRHNLTLKQSTNYGNFYPREH